MQNSNEKTEGNDNCRSLPFFHCYFSFFSNSSIDLHNNKRRNSATFSSSLSTTLSSKNSKPVRVDTSLPFSDLFTFLSDMKPVQLPSDIRTSSFTLRFHERAIERAFLKYYQLSSLKTLRLGTALYIILVVLVTELLEYTSMRYPDWLTHVLRLGLVVPLFVAIYIASIVSNEETSVLNRSIFDKKYKFQKKDGRKLTLSLSTTGIDSKADLVETLVEKDEPTEEKTITSADEKLPSRPLYFVQG